MFSDNTTKRLVAIQNEQRAQKTSSKLNGGSLNLPGSTPTASYSGFVANSNADTTARWIATFTRTDGIALPPYVEFAWDFSLAKYTYEDLLQTPGTSVTNVTGRDKQAIDQVIFIEGVYEVGANYVKWRIDISPDRYWYFSGAGGTTVTLAVQAVSTVIGTLTLVRVI